ASAALYRVPLHDALPISGPAGAGRSVAWGRDGAGAGDLRRSGRGVGVGAGADLDGDGDAEQDPWAVLARGLGDRPRQVVGADDRSEEHTSELQSRENLVC